MESVFLMAIPSWGGERKIMCLPQGSVNPSMAIAGNPLLEEALRAQNAGRIEDAARLYEQVLRYQPDNFVACGNLGMIRWQAKDYGASEPLLRRALALAPANPEAHVNLALTFQDLGRFDEAIACCEAALKRSPEHRRALDTLAGALAAAGRYEQAIALLSRIVRKRPGHAKAYAYLGTLYAKLGRLDEAVREFRQASNIDRSDAVSMAAAAECLLLTGKAEESLIEADKALALNAYDVRALGLKTLALAELGRRDEERWLSDPERLIHAHRLSDIGYGAEDVVRLNRALSAFAQKEPTLREDPPQYATFKGWHSTRNLADYPDAPIEELKRFIRHGFEARLARLAEEDAAHPLVRAAPRDYRLDLWTVKLRGGGGKMLPHIHVDGWLSGVYYVDVPAVVDDPGAGGAGWIKFGTPRADMRISREPLTRTVKPEPGKMLTFPSYFWHDTVPLPEGRGEHRLCYSWDYQPLR
jgi:tetratricopeptide (TPR) repeat protein